MTPAISVRNLGKRYRVGRAAARGPYRTLRESLAQAATAPLRRLRGETDGASEDFWALKDVSFDVQPGEVVGIIGRNGAGKSTLLKILSRITTPTVGEVEINGRVGSLLEVGTGFHPELTGRENIYMNGSILGMSRREIARRFDQIVSFAEVERFLDTPVKRYSSGMYVRLAFAVAAYLEPEILVVDEVLAVGDADFQKKCLGRMRDVSRSGRTVLFVSHNITCIESLCDRCCHYADGRLLRIGPCLEVVRNYYESSQTATDAFVELSQHKGRTANSQTVMTSVELRNDFARPARQVAMGESLLVHVEFSARPPIRQPVLGVVVKTSLGAPVFGVNNRFIPGFDLDCQSPRAAIECRLDQVPLMPGVYWLDLWFGDAHRDIDVVYEAASFEVTAADVFSSGKLPPSSAGPIAWPATWRLCETSSEPQYV